MKLDAFQAERFHAAQFRRDIGEAGVHRAEREHGPAVLLRGPGVDRLHLIGAGGHGRVEAAGNAGLGHLAQQAGAGAVVAGRVAQAGEELLHDARSDVVREDVHVGVKNWAGGVHVWDYDNWGCGCWQAERWGNCGSDSGKWAAAPKPLPCWQIAFLTGLTRFFRILENLCLPVTGNPVESCQSCQKNSIAPSPALPLSELQARLLTCAPTCRIL